MRNRNAKVFLWSMIVALGGFLFGFDTAVISGVEKNIQELFKLTPFWQGFTISSALIGTIIGALVAGSSADKYGRKPVLYFTALLFLISAVGSGLADHLFSFCTWRFLGGIGVGASSVIAPMYISEIAPAKVRGRMTALFQFNVIFGILIAYISNYFLRDIDGLDSWRWMLGIGGLPAVIFFVLLFVVPESPRYLIGIGNLELAGLTLIQAGNENVTNEINDIKSSVHRKREKLFSRAFSRPIAIAFLVAMFNQFSGINAILYYAPRIFELSGMSAADSFLQPILMGVTNAVFTILGLIIIDRVGRRKLLIVGSIGMAICLGLVANAFYQQNFGGNSLLICLIGYIMFFAFSTGAVIWVLISEVFPSSVRGQGQSLGCFTHWFFATLITFIFPVLVGEFQFGGAFAFGFFAAMMVLQAVVVWIFFPETKGKTLEEISVELVGNGQNVSGVE